MRIRLTDTLVAILALAFAQIKLGHCFGWEGKSEIVLSNVSCSPLKLLVTHLYRVPNWPVVVAVVARIKTFTSCRTAAFTIGPVFSLKVNIQALPLTLWRHILSKAGSTGHFSSRMPRRNQKSQDRLALSTHRMHQRILLEHGRQLAHDGPFADICQTGHHSLRLHSQNNLLQKNGARNVHLWSRVILNRAICEFSLHFSPLVRSKLTQLVISEGKRARYRQNKRNLKRIDQNSGATWQWSTSFFAFSGHHWGTRRLQQQQLQQAIKSWNISSTDPETRPQQSGMKNMSRLFDLFAQWSVQLLQHFLTSSTRSLTLGKMAPTLWSCSLNQWKRQTTQSELGSRLSTTTASCRPVIGHSYR